MFIDVGAKNFAPTFDILGVLMARIQKKKPSVKRKGRPEEVAGTQVSSVQSEADDARPTAVAAGADGADADKEKKKKQSPATIQAAAPESSAILKLTDKYFGTWIQFFREVRVELGKVAWPSRKQTIGSTAVVIIFVFMIALFLGVVDFGLSNIIRLIL
jgi:preprotein translocase subunit SecE